jgi:SAM-dependent methyltransferase
MSRTLASDPGTVESQYNEVIEAANRLGFDRFGLAANASWRGDPRQTLFMLSRYKFVSKMLAGRERVLEVGCGDAFGTRIVQQTVGHITAVDIDPIFIVDAKERMDPQWPLTALVHDIVSGPVSGVFDAVFGLDVLEHIALNDENRFLNNAFASLTPSGVAIFGMPSIESQKHASARSKAGHVNCKSGQQLKETLERFFNTVFVFSMNDEVVHTGFFPMANYIVGVGSHLKR